MVKKIKTPKPNRYLKQIGYSFYYKRNVPKHMEGIDRRFPRVTKALGTRDIMEAREKRDYFERTDNQYWNAVKLGANPQDAGDVHKATIMAQQVMALERQDPRQIVNKLRSQLDSGIPLHETEFYNRLVEAESALGSNRKKLVASAIPKLKAGELPTPEEFEAIKDLDERKPDVLDSNVGVVFMNAALNTVPQRVIATGELFDFYCNEVAKDDWRTKSPEQVRQWQKWPRKACSELISIVGTDLDFLQLTSNDADRHYETWNEKLDQLNPRTGKPYSGSAANREIEVMKRVLNRSAKKLGVKNYHNPYSHLERFAENPNVREPVPTDFLKTVFLQGNKLEELNDQARCIWLTMIETGARLGEIACLTPKQIHLSDNIPHIHITSINDGQGKKRRVKTKSADRKIPLIGVSLEAIRKHPNGFPKYFDRAAALSGLLAKYAKNNGLIAVEGQSATHSVRHAFKDRLREAGVQEKLIDAIMGHAEKGEKYGSGFSLEKKLEALNKIALPFDANII